MGRSLSFSGGGAGCVRGFCLVVRSIYNADGNKVQGRGGDGMSRGRGFTGRNKSLFLLKNHHMTTCLAEILERFGNYPPSQFSGKKSNTDTRESHKCAEVRWCGYEEDCGSACRNIFPIYGFLS